MGRGKRSVNELFISCFLFVLEGHDGECMIINIIILIMIFITYAVGTNITTNTHT